MEPQSSGINLKVGLAFIAGLVIGGVSGYFIGSYATMQSINEQIATEVAANASNESANALDDVETNPLENVRLNPFE